VTVPARIWSEPGPLTQDEREQVRLHAHHSERVLTAATALRPLARPAGLSERECEMLGLLARGLATKQIARQLGISPKTCDHYIQSVYAKARVSSRAAATMFALEHGLVGPTPRRAGTFPDPAAHGR
jgi:DNA-binding NarL/FixJ family response regulator